MCTNVPSDPDHPVAATLPSLDSMTARAGRAMSAGSTLAAPVDARAEDPQSQGPCPGRESPAAGDPLDVHDHDRAVDRVESLVAPVAGRARGTSTLTAASDPPLLAGRPLAQHARQVAPRGRFQHLDRLVEDAFEQRRIEKARPSRRTTSNARRSAPSTSRASRSTSSRGPSTAGRPRRPKASRRRKPPRQRHRPGLAIAAQERGPQPPDRAQRRGRRRRRRSPRPAPRISRNRASRISSGRAEVPRLAEPVEHPGLVEAATRSVRNGPGSVGDDHGSRISRRFPKYPAGSAPAIARVPAVVAPGVQIANRVSKDRHGPRQRGRHGP